MVKLSHNLRNGKRFQSVDIFRNRSISFGWYNGFNGAGISLTFDVPAEEADDPKARTYRMEVPNDDLKQLLGYVLNPNYTMGFFGRGEPSATDRHFKDLLAEIGVKTKLYRYNQPRGLNDYFYVDAVNDEHAEFQFRRIFKENFDSSKMEAVEDVSA